MTPPDDEQPNVADAQAALAAALTRVHELSDDAPGTGLAVTRSDDPVEAKRQIAKQQAELARAEEVVRRASAELERQMKAQLDAVKQALVPIQKVTKRLGEAMFSINLYLGGDEDILLLRDGDSAPEDTPVTLRQMLLFMDEEMAAAAPVERDANLREFLVTDAPMFDEWLLADPAHLNQVLPEQKGVVALRPRRREPNHRQLTQAEAAFNRNTYWLIRNGDRVYRTLTPLKLSDRILPYSDEIKRLFMRENRDGTERPLTPGSPEWDAAQASADSTEQTYMRVGLVLEGLLHRTPIFHPLPEGGVSFLDPRDVEARKVIYITDLERALGDGHESFREWRKRLASELRPGMRIVLGPGLERFTRESGWGKNYRLHPEVANRPEIKTLYTLEQVKPNAERDWYEGGRATALIFRYREGARYVGDSSYGGGEYREPKRRATCTVYPEDDFVLPFDVADVDDMRRFLRARTDRHNYEAMFPILRSAIAAKEREAEVEAPFRTMLLGVLARDNGVTVAEAEEAVDDLIHWWKFKNKSHRPLLLAAELAPETPDPYLSGEGVPISGESLNRALAELGLHGRAAQRRAEGERARAGHADRLIAEAEEADLKRGAMAVTMIVAEHKRRLKDARRPVDGALVARLKTHHPNWLLVARPRERGYLVVTAAEPNKNVYVHEHEYSAKGEPVETREWLIPQKRTILTWKVVEQTDRWGEWDFNATDAQHLRGPEREQLLEQARTQFEANTDGLPLVFAQDRKTGEFSWWTFAKPASFDLDHLLTVRPEPTVLRRHDRKWRRQKHGGVTLRGGSSRGSSGNDATDERIHHERDAHPWNAPAYDSRFNSWDKDDGTRPRKYKILATNEKNIAEFDADLARYFEADRQEDELRVRVRALTDSVKEQWLRDQWIAERARFDHDFGDPVLWPKHRESKERHIQFPHNKWELVPNHLNTREAFLYSAIARFVEVGEDPEGRTAGEVVDAATERWPIHDFKRESGKSYSNHGNGWVDSATGEKAAIVVTPYALADELRDYPLSDYEFKHAPDPEQGSNEAELDSMVEALVGSVQRQIADAALGDREAEPEFDAEAHSEDDTPQLPAGDDEAIDAEVVDPDEDDE